MVFWLDLYKNGWRLTRREVDGTLDQAIEVAMLAMRTHKASSARLVDPADKRVVWRGYPDAEPGGASRKTLELAVAALHGGLLLPIVFA